MAQKTVQKDEEGSSVEANSKDRAASGKGAGTSGRGDDRPAKGEDWDQEEFGKGERKSSCVMVEHPAGSNVWFNGTPLKWTDTDVQFSLGVDNVRSPPSVWVRLTSSRIWRGSLDTKNWKYCSSKNGAWKPKAPACARRASGSKGRGGPGRKRKAVTEPQDSDYVNGEATGTTKAQQDSDEEMVDTGHCTSPRQIGNSGAAASDGTCDPVKASPSGKQEDKGSAKPSKGPPLEVKEDGGMALQLPPPKPSNANLVYQAWLSRHFRLLETQGQLNLAPEGCNPEAGRLPGAACADSNRTAEGSMRGRETSSSSGSAGLRQQGSHTGRKLPPVSKCVSKPVAVLMPPRSPSPSTPSKPVDGSRRERSSSADLDLRAHPTGVPQQGSGALQDVGSHGGKSARVIPPGGDGGPHAAVQSPEKRQGHAHGGGRKSGNGAANGGGRASGASEGRGAKQSGKEPLSVKQGQGVSKQQATVKAQKKVKTGWVKTGPGLQTSPSLKRSGSHVATLVETDPFTLTEPKKLRAC